MPAKLIYFVSEDWVFCSHRLPLAVAARQAGFDVLVVTRVLRHGELITNAGLRLIHFNLIRRGMNPLKEFMAIFRLWRLYRKEKPDVVHHVALKPVLYGSIAARMAGVPIVVNAYTGLGFLFISPKRYVKWARFLVIKLLCLMNAGGEVRSIFQNPDDMALMADAVRGSIIELIRGSGVDTELFPASPENQGVPLVVLPARMLWDKGVAEFVQAAGQLRGAGVVARFVLVGDRDDGNPSAISSSQLALWNAQGNVEWWGQRNDMATILAQANIVCLPSYREGVPKALLEAAACARAIVTTDVPGCREIVKHGVNGFLVPAKDAQALADAMRELIENADLRKRMGLKGRELVEGEFSLKHVIPRTLRLYAPSL